MALADGSEPGGGVGGDGDADDDGDGQSNAAEALAGTDPNNAADYLRVSAIDRTEAAINLAWTSVDGRSYEVEYSNDLQPGNWVVIGSVTSAGAASSFEDTDASRLASGTGYYRARVRTE